MKVAVVTGGGRGLGRAFAQAFAESDARAWWRTLEVNLQGQILCAHRVLPGMIAQRCGRIINIASGGGAAMLPYFSACGTSKTALIRFCECLANELQPARHCRFRHGPRHRAYRHVGGLAQLARRPDLAALVPRPLR